MSADTSSFVATMAEMERAEAAEQELLLRRFAGAGPVGGFLDDDEEEEELFGTAPRVTDMDGDGASHSSVSAFASAVADVAFSRHTVSASLLFEDNEESFGDQSAIEEPPDASPLRLPLRSVERVQARSKAFNGFDAPASSGVVAFDAPASAADGLDASARTNLSTTSAAEVLNASASFRRRRGGKTRGGARRVAPSAVGVDDKSPVPQEPLSVSAHSNDEAYTLSDHVSTPVPHPHALGVTSHVTPEERQVYQNQMHREPRQRLWGAKAVAAGNSVSPAMDKIVRVAGEGGTSQSGRSRIIQGRALRYATDDEDITKNDQVTWDDVGYVGSEEGDQSHAHRPLYHASPPSKNRSFLCAKSTVLTEEKKKKRTYVLNRGANRTFKKTDPVARFHAMNRTWRKDKFLRGSAKRAKSKTNVASLSAPSPTASPAPKRLPPSSARKAVDSSAFGYGFASPLRNFSSTPYKQRPIKVNDYVVPTSKKRDALRWNVRARMMDVS
eukprot:INCI5744.1.p1 GENE.INCI5744.1~~INCI5744.1.p1  ORF type:complete len:521 (+),score=91.70 INCI5744.1:69-1565(+)